MQYSDAWHPSWKAKINGRFQKLQIKRAYKALPLQQGKNLVRLYAFESKPVEWLCWLYGELIGLGISFDWAFNGIKKTPPLAGGLMWIYAV